jgi:hypothetical protein
MDVVRRIARDCERVRARSQLTVRRHDEETGVMRYSNQSVARLAPLALAGITATTLTPTRAAAAPDGDVAAQGVIEDQGEADPHDDDDDDDTHDDRDNGDRDEDDEDDRDDIDGADGARLRLNIESEALGGSYFASDSEGVDDSLSFGFGLARPSLVDGGNAVFARPLLSIGLGYLFPGERAILGAKVAFTVDGYGIQNADRLVAVGGRLVPYFQWMFLPERWARPYVEVRAGFGGSGTTARDRDGVDGRVTTGFIYPMVGAGGGVHLFPREWFSIDLGLNVDYVAPFSRTKADEDPPGDSDWDKVGDVINFGLALGVSAWF